MADAPVEHPTFNKTPAEDYAIGLTYTTDKLPVGAILLSGTATATLISDGSDVTGTIIPSPTLVIAADGLSWSVGVDAGVDGEDYLIRALITLTNSLGVLEDCVILEVRDC